MSPQNKKPTILYIGGDGRSGSTLLDTILSNHPEMFGGGELEALFEDLAENGACSCGELYTECDYWKEILALLYARIPGLDVEVAARDREIVESPIGRLKFGNQLLAQSQKRYGELWSTLMQAICDVSEKPTLIDSSKSAYGNARRIHALHTYAGMNLNVLHLIRDPRAVVYSEWGRGNNKRLEFDVERPLLDGGMVKPLAGWVIANLAVSMTTANDKTIPVHRIHYENLVTDPIATLEGVEQFLESDFSTIIDLLRHNKSLTGGHGVRGNRMRRKGPITMKVDTEWVESMPVVARYCTKSLWPVARYYGYNVLNWPTVHSYLAMQNMPSKTI